MASAFRRLTASVLPQYHLGLTDLYIYIYIHTYIYIYIYVYTERERARESGDCKQMPGRVREKLSSHSR